MVVGFELETLEEFGETGPKANRSKTAILLLDFQNEFAKSGGKLHNGVASVMESTGMLNKVPHVVRAARESGALVIHSPVFLKSGEKFSLSDIGDHHSFGSIDDIFIEGTWNAEFADETKPAEHDIIIKNRKFFSALTGTNLKSVLQKNKIQRLFIMGFLTNMCIEDTVIELSENMPEIARYVLIDGCAANSEREHFNATGSALPLFATLVSCSEAQTLLRLSPPSKNPGVRTSMNASLRNSSRPELQPNFRPRILALHGARSNDNVTKLQLQNLNITEEDYDIVYLRGPIEVEDGDPALEGLVYGPFYSWFDEDEAKLGASLVAAVRDVLTVTKARGPFDGVYGFSSGGHVAALAAGIKTDPALQKAIGSAQRGSFSRKSKLANSRRVSSATHLHSQRKSSATQRKSSTTRRGSTLVLKTSLRRGSIFAAATVLEEEDFTSPPFCFVVLACSASPTPDLATLRMSAGLGSVQLEPDSMTTKSFHLIGIEDGFKAHSEEIAALFADRHVMYLPGGHTVGRDERSDEELCLSLRVFMRTLGSPPPKAPVPDFVPMSEVSSIALLPHIQVALVKLNHDLLPEGSLAQYHGGGATIMALLAAQPAEKPFLYNARGTDDADVTTYGDVFNFIHGGAGDLRRLGVKAGEVVAYAAPPGGAAAAALAFLSIGAQTAAAPLAPNTTEPDALDALDQFKANHLILFDGVDCPGVEVAFAAYAASGKAKLHKATILSNGRPGMFEYPEGKDIDGAALTNPENGNCLLLRTSGTTARPKGVPLQQGALITNGAIIASSMGLQESDVCYSVMPLFHIGGISASILCTLASGGSVSCDSELFDASRMIDALAISRPQPTWYSSVPTIHNATVAYLKDVAPSDPKCTAYGINSEGIWSKGHSLRMIRSGAAALLGPDGDALAGAYGGVPIYPTYSMSEQMPISQPPAGKRDTFTAKRGSVGMPVAASTAIVSRSRLRPQPRGLEGEIAISGPTVLKNYLNNPAADLKAYFYLTLPTDEDEYDQVEDDRFFLTGDVGTIDDDGFLTLKGRAKELIKKGGEQVSPFEVEEPLLTHPWVQIPVCFAVPSKLYGEEVGCALVLSSKAPQDVEKREVIVAMRAWLKEAKLAPVKWPTKWVICADSELPKTGTKKYIRIGLSTVLGLDPEEDESMKTKDSKEGRAKLDWGVLGGLRFILALYVMFMHIGSNKSWGAVSNARGFPWHVHVFFTLGGYTMASPMNPVIQKRFSYFVARIGSMYPMYCVSLFFALINLIVVCRPSTFSKDFHWDSQPYDLYTEDGELAPLFCEGTPATPNSYWASLVLTILTYIFGLAVTPTWPLAWWLGYYLWFNSMYYQCLAVFPATYNALFNRARKNVRLLLQLIVALMVLNVAILLGAWYGSKDEAGYNHYSPATGEKNPVEEYNDASAHNIVVLSFYLFGPFWMLYFVIGACTAFLYDAYRPAERHSAWVWGCVADSCTLIIFGLVAATIAQGTQTYGELPEAFYFRPDEADEFTDTAVTYRIWDNINARLACPVTTLWIFSLSTGQGYTAALFRREFLVETLSPNSYNCFLFHQMVGQWYYAATRNGTWWNWWRFRKTQYWFSPDPCPVEWYEYFLVVGLVVSWSRLMMVLEPLVSTGFANVIAYFTKGEADGEEEDTVKVICDIIESMTGIEPLPDWTLEECGLASIGVPVLVGLLNKAFAKKDKAFAVSARDLVSAETIADMVAVVDNAKKLADAQGV